VSDVTVAQWLEEWRRRRIAIGKHSPHHAINVESLIRNYVTESPLSRVMLTDLRPAHVANWYDEMVSDLRAERGSAGLVAAKCYRVVHAALEDAVDRGLLPQNPARVPDAGLEDSPERPLVTAEQVEQIAVVIHPRFSVLVVMGAWVGLRLSELARLERRDVDPMHGRINVRQSKSKAGVRTVVLPPQIAELVDAHLGKFVGPDPGALVFTGLHGGRLSQNVLRKHWRAAADGVVPGLHFHDLRHHGATVYAQTGATTRELMKHVGHSSQRASIRYQHVAETREDELAKRLGDLYALSRTAAPRRLRDRRS
jgi:integrase